MNEGVNGELHTGLAFTAGGKQGCYLPGRLDEPGFMQNSLLPPFQVLLQREKVTKRSDANFEIYVHPSCWKRQ